jgi:hypothetical protein
MPYFVHCSPVNIPDPVPNPLPVPHPHHFPLLPTVPPPPPAPLSLAARPPDTPYQPASGRQKYLPGESYYEIAIKTDFKPSAEGDKEKTLTLKTAGSLQAQFGELFFFFFFIRGLCGTWMINLPPTPSL